MRILNGNDVAAERKRYRLSQSDFVKEVPNMDRPTLSRIETNAVKLEQEEYERLIRAAQEIGAKQVL